jgi:hypothetical protein
MAQLSVPGIEVLKESTPIMPTGSLDQRMTEATAEISEATDAIIATRIDREGWAAMVRSLIAVHSRGNLQRFSRTVGIDARTIRRWLDCDVDASFDSVCKVGVVTGVSFDALLKSAGYLGPREEDSQDESVNVALQEEFRLIDAVPLDNAIRRWLVRYVVDRQERDRRARIEDLKLSLDLLRQSLSR